MKVLIIPSWYATVRHPITGIYVKEQAHFVRQVGMEVSMLFANLGPLAHGIPLKKQYKPYFKKEDEIPTYRMDGFLPPKRNKLFIWTWLNLYDKLFQFYVKQEDLPDLIHAHSYLAGYFAFFLKQKYHIPYLLTEHGSSFLLNKDPRFPKVLIEKAFMQANRLIAVSPSLKEKLLNYTDKDIDVIPNLVNTKVFTPGIIPKSKNFRFLFIGSLIDLKNPILLINAFAAFQKLVASNTELVMIGQGPLQKRIEKLIKTLQLENSIRLYKEQTKAEIATQMSQAHVLVLPSKVETFGIVLIEAMACGLPVIASRCGGPDSIIKEEAGLLVPPNDQEALVMALLKIYENYNSFDPEFIRELVQEKFSAPKVAKELIQIYQSIL